MDEMERPYHEVANIFPLLNGAEYQELKNDIEQNGQIEPIWLHPDGSIIDGRNRHRACIELEKRPVFREWEGNGSLLSFVVSLNLHRRHLTSSQRAAISLDVLPMLEIEARERQGERNDIWECEYCGHRNKYWDSECGNCHQNIREIIPESNGKAVDSAAALFGTNGRYVQDVKTIKKKAPDLFDKVKAGEKTIPAAKKELRKREKEQRKNEIPADLPEVGKLWRVIHCPVENIASKLEPGSIDHIITDPPYPYEYICLYEHLARAASYLLKPGGSLLVMCGQSYLPEIFQLMTPHIKYQWVVSYLTPGGQSPQIWDRKVNTFWKPVLWFVNGEYQGDWIGDVSKSGGNDKRFHHWGQSESGMGDLIERFTYPGETILDPFCGGGATGRAAIDMNRYFIGSDIDKDETVKTAARLGV